MEKPLKSKVKSFEQLVEKLIKEGYDIEECYRQRDKEFIEHGGFRVYMPSPLRVKCVASKNNRRVIIEGHPNCFTASWYERVQFRQNGYVLLTTDKLVIEYILTKHKPQTS